MFDEIRDALPDELRPQLAAIVNQMVDLTGQVAHWQRTCEFMRTTNERQCEHAHEMGRKVEIARQRAGLFKQRLRMEREAHNTTKNQLANERKINAYLTTENFSLAGELVAWQTGEHDG